MPELIHTCYRIGDIDRSVAFYEALGFEELRRMPIRDEAINVFMGLPDDGARLELTYNHGVDSYELGTGYNHIAITASDLDATLANLAEQGIEPEKPPYTVREGGNRICFVRDPDGYRSRSSRPTREATSLVARPDSDRVGQEPRAAEATRRTTCSARSATRPRPPRPRRGARRHRLPGSGQSARRTVRALVASLPIASATLTTSFAFSARWARSARRIANRAGRLSTRRSVSV